MSLTEVFFFLTTNLPNETPVAYLHGQTGPRCQDHVEELAIISLVFLKSHDGPQRRPFTAFDCLRLSLNIQRLVFVPPALRRSASKQPGVIFRVQKMTTLKFFFGELGANEVRHLYPQLLCFSLLK